MEDGNFDVILVGTGLTESITAAALAKAGFRTLHVDESSHYGQNEASLSLDEFIEWADHQSSSNNPQFASMSHSVGILQSRQYSICLCPAIIPSIGPVISSLVSSGVSKYGGFRLLERVGIYHSSGIIKNVPGTKEDVFKSKEISLVDKRRLMRFLMFAVSDFEDKQELHGAHDTPFPEFLKTVFSLNDEIASAIVYSLAFCSSPLDATLPALHRIRRYLRSAGRYGPSPFLVGHYGGTGDVAQGFCRAAAVNGGVYILGRRLVSINHTVSSPQSLPSTNHNGPSPVPRYSITLDDFPDTLTANVIISSASRVPPHLVDHTIQLPPTTSRDPRHHTPIARCIAIIDQPIYFPPPSSSQRPQAKSELGTEDIPPAVHGPEAQHDPQYPIDAGVLVFPPSTVGGGSLTTAATVLITGEGTMSTPKGKWIVYITLPISSPVPSSASAELLLRPYLEATLALSASPASHPSQSLFTAFYIQHPDLSPIIIPSSPSSHDVEKGSAVNPKGYIVAAGLSPASPLPEAPDDAATHAEAVFWETVKLLSRSSLGSIEGADVKKVGNNDSENARDPIIDSFWPPLEEIDESGGEEGW